MKVRLCIGGIGSDAVVVGRWVGSGFWFILVLVLVSVVVMGVPV